MSKENHSTTRQKKNARAGTQLLKITIFLAVTVVSIAEDNTNAKPQTPSPLLPLTVEKYREFLPVKDNEIGALDLLKLQKEGPVVLLDVRSKESFAQRHLKGAINIPLTELTEQTLLKNIPDRTIPVVLMCDYSFQPTQMIPMTLQAHPVLAAQKFFSIFRLNLWHGKGGNAISDPSEQNKLVDFEGTEVHPK